MENVLKILFLCVGLGFSIPTWAGGDAVKGKTVYQKCISCHGSNGEGKKSQKAPRLAGQHDWYIVSQLKNFKGGVRKNPLMLPFIKKLTDQDFEDVAAYLHSLK